MSIHILRCGHRSRSFLFACLSLLITTAPSMAQTGTTTRGVRGRAARSAVVHFLKSAKNLPFYAPPYVEPEVIHKPLPVPPNLFAPEALFQPPTQSAEESIPAGNSLPEALSPTTTVNFQGLLDNNTIIPPDTQGAVGPNHLITITNSQVRIHNRSGATISTDSLTHFFSSVYSGGIAFDPRCLYDPFGSRWIIAAGGANLNGAPSNSAILLAISQTSDPTGNWNLYRVNVDPTNQTWADYPILGFNKDWIVVTANIFIGLSGYAGDNIWAFDKSKLYTNHTANFTLLTDQTGGFAMCPATTYDNTLSTLYLLENWNGNFNGNGYLRLSTITGAVGSETLTSGTVFPSKNSPWADGDPGDFAPQKGTTGQVNTGDTRTHRLLYRNGSLWSAHTVYLPVDAPDHSAVQWWQLSTAGSVQQFGRIDDPNGLIFRAYPSLAVNANSDMLIGYTRFSANEFPSAYYSFRYKGDTSNTLQSENLLKAGLASYFKTFGGPNNRWGDYSQTLVDPVDDLALWTLQEYAASPANTWGTWWGQVSVPVISALGLDQSSVTGGTSVTGTVTLTANAQIGGAIVKLSSNSAKATVPASVTVAAGSSTKTFTITTSSVSVNTPVMITATTGNLNQTAALTLTTAQATVSGTITLQDCVNSAQPLTFVFRPTDNSGNITKTTTLSGTGTFSIANLPAKNYNVWIKGDKWLAKVVAVNASGGNVSNVMATLLGGDADNNNTVDFDDLTILAIAYNTATGDPLFDARADFNCDGLVEFADLTMLAINYNLSGDP